MSLDHFHECSICKAIRAVHLWIGLYGSLDHARSSQHVADFLSFAVPGPIMIKVEVCFACQRFVPVLEYTEEETKGLEEEAAGAQKAGEVGRSLFELLALFRTPKGDGPKS